jgi:hypothetical protein
MPSIVITLPRTMPGSMLRRLHPLSCFACFVFGSVSALAQQAATSQQPLNASVSDYGTTFVFSPPPVCKGCLETELGFQSIEDGLYIPSVLTFAPLTRTDFSALVNLLDSETSNNARSTHFGSSVDLVLRQKLFEKGGFEMTLAPRSTVLLRGGDGGRAGATAAPQYSWGNNLAILNITWTGAIDVSTANPRSDYVTSFDYYRTLQKRGTALFAGFQQELTAGQQSVNTEQGLVIPFRNGQVELETAQLDLNTGLQVQFQARVIVNWGRFWKTREEGHRSPQR